MLQIKLMKMLLRIKDLVIIPIILFCVSTAFAKEVKTPYFTLTLPEELVVESGEDKILAFGKNGPYKKPYHFMAIEFGKELDAKRLIEGINKTLEQLNPGAQVQKVDCSNNCSAYFGFATTSTEEKGTINNFFYVIQGQQITTVISYSTVDDALKAKILIDLLAKEVSSGNKR